MTHYVGIDENGMGPRLGPMVVTSVLARVDPAAGGEDLANARARGALEGRIGDSKKLVTAGDTRLGEAWARAIAERMGAGTAPSTPARLLGAIALDSEATLRAPCPSHHADLCWSLEGERFAASDDDVAHCKRDLVGLRARGFEVLGVRVAIVCNRRLNEAVSQGLSRFDVDLHTMERLALSAREEAGAELQVLCGKVGGIDFYGPRFGPLGGRLHLALCEGRARSEYQVPGLGRIAFLRDADDSHLIVGLASLVGKWARDLMMRRIVTFFRAHVPDAPEASGYHDPVSNAFVESTALVRKKLRIEPSCFERGAVGKRAKPTSSAPKKPKPPKARSSEER